MACPKSLNECWRSSAACGDVPANQPCRFGGLKQVNAHGAKLLKQTSKRHVDRREQIRRTRIPPRSRGRAGLLWSAPFKRLGLANMARLAKPRVSQKDLAALANGRLLTIADRSFAGLDFVDGDLEGASFEECDFAGAIFRNANLTETRFAGCSFFTAEPEASCDFTFATLRDAAFQQCDLTAAQMSRSRAYGLRLVGCNAGGLDLSQADFGLGVAGRNDESPFASATFEDCNMPWANFTGANLNGCTLAKCRLVEAVFTEANLSGADLRESNLSNIVTRNLRLTGADLRGAVFANLDPRSVALERVRIHPEQALMLLQPLQVDVDTSAATDTE